MPNSIIIQLKNVHEVMNALVHEQLLCPKQTIELDHVTKRLLNNVYQYLEIQEVAQRLFNLRLTNTDNVAITSITFRPYVRTITDQIVNIR